jgi:hypothetical protein
MSQLQHQLFADSLPDNNGGGRATMNLIINSVAFVVACDSMKAILSPFLTAVALVCG